ncbi:MULTISPECIES: PAS domain-containing protein [Kordiimonas]|uniref:PAS domain-containing protein n=1 Tax=Kordiimonas lacus TaxID=637679 RepID=A0A1G6UB29_9PROT|nr:MULTISPECIES: PAS domain-containing protein [Kordiimonas]SDD37787.1 PAS domain-containing protein [Kordiimonas lacus]
MLNLEHSILPPGTEFGEFVIHGGKDVVGKNPIMDFFYDYWLSKHTGDKLPCRADVRPTEIRKHLDHLVIMDVTRDHEPFGLHVRLIGTHVANFYGEISGKDIREMTNQIAANRIYHTSALVLSENVPQLCITPAISPDREYLEAFALYLPLYDDAGEIEKILVAVDVVSRRNSRLF